MSDRRASHVAIDVATVSMLLAAGLVGFAPLFSGLHWLLVGLLALLCGVGIGWWGARRRWPVMPMVGATMAAYCAIGMIAVFRSTLVAGVVPTPSTVLRLAQGTVSAWKDLLTVHVPSEGFETILIVVLVATLTCTVTAITIALRTRYPAWAMAPVVTLLAVSMLFGMYRAAFPLVQGLTVMGVGVAWLSWRRHQLRTGGIESFQVASAQPVPSRTTTMRRLAAGAAVLVAALVAGGLVSATSASDAQRFALRDEVVPPLDLRDYPSPLQSFRSYVRDYEQESLFTVTGLPAHSRVRLATLDVYDGVVFAVAGDGSATSGNFARVGQTIPTDSEGVSATVTVTIDSLRGVWLPTVGSTTSIAFSSPRADQLSQGLYYNHATGTAVVTAGVARGDSYTMTAVIEQFPALEDLDSYHVASMRLPAHSNIPGIALEKALEAVGDNSAKTAQLVAMRDYLSGAGFFSHGLDGQPQSRSGHGSERILALLGADQMLGDDEQYAVAYALMAHELGIPARVVMGFVDESGSSTVVANSDTARVWVEVAIADLGWVVVDPAPDKDKIPTDEDQSPQREPQPQILQPPPPPEEPPTQPQAVPTDDEMVNDSGIDAAAILRVVLVVLVAVGILALLAGPFLTIVLLKWRRRQRRRRAEDHADRVVGGWEEVTDLALDYGVGMAPHATRRERSAVVAATFGAQAPMSLAQSADAFVWSPDPVTDEDSRNFWDVVHATLTEMERGRSRAARFKARLSLRSLVAARVTRRAERARHRTERTTRVR